MDSTSALITAATGFATAISGYFLGVKKTKADVDNTIVDGAKKVMDASAELMERIKANHDEEHKHRVECEHNLAKIKGELDEVVVELRQLKREVHGSEN